jgi:hypothetical protein
VLGGELLVAFSQCQRLRRLNETAGAIGIFFKIHLNSLSLFRSPNWRGRDIVTGRLVRLNAAPAEAPHQQM